MGRGDNNSADITYYRWQLNKAQTAYDGVFDKLETTENKLRAMTNANNNHWHHKYTEANIQKEAYKNVAEDDHKHLERNIEQLASVKMMHDVHNNQKEKYKQGRDLYKASYDKEKLEHEELKDKHNKMKRERDEWKEKKASCMIM